MPGMHQALMAAAGGGVVVNPLTPSASSWSGTVIGTGGLATCQMSVFSDGTVQITQGPDAASPPSPTNGQWFNPTTAGIGNSYWVRFTRTAFTPGVTGTASASTGWLALSSTRLVTVTCTDDNGNPDSASATYTVDIASDSSGTNIVSSGTGGFTFFVDAQP